MPWDDHRRTIELALCVFPIVLSLSVTIHQLLRDNSGSKRAL